MGGVVSFLISYDAVRSVNFFKAESKKNKRLFTI